MSWESKQFQDVLEKGEESEYYPMFLTMSSVFPNGATEEDLAGIYRPRPGLPFTHYKFAGKTRLVWVSFTPQQVDIDTDSDKGWEYLMSISTRWPHPTSATFVLTPSLRCQGSRYQLLHDAENVQAHLPPARGGRQARLGNPHRSAFLLQEAGRDRVEGRSRLRFRPSAAAAAFAEYRSCRAGRALDRHPSEQCRHRT